MNKTHTSTNNANKLAIKMATALIIGLIAGTSFIFLREKLISSGNSDTWTMINNLLFQDITKPEANNAIGIFYIVGQLFINSLQLVIVPMVFTSITLAMCNISDTKKLGRISYKTILGFLGTSVFALILAGIFGMIANKLGLFNVSISNISSSEGSVASNPLLVFVQAIPNNITSVFGENGRVLSIVFLASVTGICINSLGNEILVLKKLLQDINKIITTFLTFVITKFGPIAIFILITRTFAIYGVEHLKPALAYVGTTTIALILFLTIGYALFGFSTSSSAATLPLNTKTIIEDLGVSEEIASFTLPLGMTINMNGTAIMQVIAAIFIASSSGYEVTVGNILIISVLALIASIGTPAAPGAGAIILFTVLTGMGYQNDAAVLAYSLILAINRPIEMLVTSLNVVGDAATAVYVSKSENNLNEEIYNG